VKAVEVDSGFHAPTKIPKDIKIVAQDEPPPPASSSMGVMGGMAGGAPGGVFGGTAGGTGSGPVVVAKPVAPKGPARISGGVMAGSIVTRVQPVYPPIAKVAHMSGTVVLRAIITKTGTISSLTVVSSTNQMFNNSALEAVKQWKYKPYMLTGEPTEVDTTITVNFTLNGS
jgi:protein TonB